MMTSPGAGAGGVGVDEARGRVASHFEEFQGCVTFRFRGRALDFPLHPRPCPPPRSPAQRGADFQRAREGELNTAGHKVLGVGDPLGSRYNTLVSRGRLTESPLQLSTVGG